MSWYDRFEDFDYSAAIRAERAEHIRKQNPLAEVKTLEDLDLVLKRKAEAKQASDAFWQEIKRCAGHSGPRDGCRDDQGYSYCHRHQYATKPAEVTMPTVEQIAECVARLAAVKGERVKK